MDSGNLIECLLREREGNLRGTYFLLQLHFAVSTVRSEELDISLKDALTLLEIKTGKYLGTPRVCKDCPSEVIGAAFGSFCMFDSMLDTLTEGLSSDTLKAFHSSLLSCRGEELRSGIELGQYIQIEGIEDSVKSLLKQYSSADKTLKNIVKLYIELFNLNLFGCYTKSVCNAVLFRECLVNNISPIIVTRCNSGVFKFALEDAIRGFYDNLLCHLELEQSWLSNLLGE